MAAEPEPAGARSERDTPAPSDEELMAAVQRGDDDAFAVLVRRYEAPLFAYLHRLSGQAADAEDLFQETFLRVYRKARRYDPKKPFRPWVYRIATNAFRDRWRRTRWRGEVALDAPGAGREASLRDAPGNRPDAQAHAADVAGALRRAVDELPPKLRAVFVMARYEELPYEEIAASLGIPVGTVKSRMHKAVNTLSKRLDGLLR